MLTIKIDPLSDLTVRWPTKEAGWLALGKKYVTREKSLPAAEQMLYPSWQTVEAALQGWETAVNQFQSGKSGTIKQIGDYKSLLNAAQPRLDLALIQLKAKYYGKWQELAAWGVTVTSSARGYNVRKPRTAVEWLTFLKKYVQQESSLPANQRITEPPLAELSTALASIQAAQGGSEDSQAAREAAVRERKASQQAVSELLQVACAILVLKQYGGKVHSGLQYWGYDVAELGSKSGGAPSGGGAK